MHTHTHIYIWCDTDNFIENCWGAGGVFSCVYNNMNNTIVYEHLYTYTFIYMNISCHCVNCTLITWWIHATHTHVCTSVDGYGDGWVVMGMMMYWISPPPRGEVKFNTSDVAPYPPHGNLPTSPPSLDQKSRRGNSWWWWLVDWCWCGGGCDVFLIKWLHT